MAGTSPAMTSRSEAPMDIFVLLATMFTCFLLGVPIAYALALAAIAGAVWIGIPLEAIMLKISDGVSKVAMLTIPFFVLAGVSGSSVADTSAIGSVMIPQMEKAGYPRVFATNVTITASVQALLVPP